MGDATGYDFGPLFGSTVGFDRVFDLLQSATRGRSRKGTDSLLMTSSAPARTRYRITLAVAGFREDELSDYRRAEPLFVEGEHRSTEAPGAEREFLHRGIGARAFKQRFQLADHVKVTGASLMDGLLTIELVREIPEVLRPRRIEVERKTAETKPAADRRSARRLTSRRPGAGGSSRPGSAPPNLGSRDLTAVASEHDAAGRG